MEHYTKIRRSFFENINKINKPLAKLTNGNSDRIQMNKIRNEKGNITAKTEEFQKNHQILLQKPIFKKNTGKSECNG